MTQESPFKVGVEVICVNTHSDRRLEGRAKVAKVYANGNFVLEGSTQQYRPRPWYGLGEDRKVTWSGYSTRDKWSREHVEVYGPEHVAEQAETKARRERQVRVNRVMEFLRQRPAQYGNLTPEQDAALIVFLATLEKENQS